MKRVLKRILPILLVIVVICSTAWYLLVYDPEFTRDMLLAQARYFESKGNHTASAWLYNQAYASADNNEEVAIELAEQFKAQGNYTQAERTLSGAIADGGSAELYIALCKTYVEQDKLLDAVTMLDNIADPTIKAQLDALRPQVPSVSHAPGFYSEYITVTLDAAGGALYTTTNGEYPSTQDGISSGIFSLAGGDNSIYALILADNGLVSPLAIYGYTVGGVIEEVTLVDSTIDELIRGALGLSPAEPLYSNQLWTLTSVSIPGSVTSYEDLRWLTYLETLTITDSTADGLESLEGLSHLHTLCITDSSISSADLETIAALPALKKLTLSGCNISTLAPLSRKDSLTYLDLSNNSIQDLSPLQFLTKIDYLDLSHNAVTSLNDISNLTALKTLDVSYNALSSIAPIAGCAALENLYIHNNTITDLSGAENWKALKLLNASFNSLTDVSALGTCPSLEELDISNNQLTDISSLVTLTRMQVFNFAWNQVTALPAWGKDCALVSIDGSNNLIETVAGLAGYQNLNAVLMDYNNISSVNALAECHYLVRVSVYGNPVTDVSALTDMGVIVYYTPKT